MNFLIPPNDPQVVDLMMRPYPRDPLWYAVRAELLRGDEPENPFLTLARDQDPCAALWVASHQLEAQWDPPDVVVQESYAVQYERLDPMIHKPVPPKDEPVIRWSARETLGIGRYE